MVVHRNSKLIQLFQMILTVKIMIIGHKSLSANQIPWFFYMPYGTDMKGYINANSVHLMLIYLAPINVTCQFSVR